MSKDKVQLLSPLFLKYQSDFEKNSRSKVFAPLAEMYRKIGMLDKAMEILATGIRYNPSYIMGYLGMAFCYFDLKQFNLAYTTLRPLVENNRDNIRLQRLFADICLELGKKEESLETFKYLLFINPRDKVVADLVIKIEAEIERQFQPIHKPIFIPADELSEPISQSHSTEELFDVARLDSVKNQKSDLDDWVTVSLNSNKQQEAISSEPNFNDNADFWNVKKVEELVESEITPVISRASKAQEIAEEFSEEPRSFHVHLDRELPGELKEENPKAPLVTHTLVDLYCGQGHIEKALEVLEKILLLNPNDQRTIEKKKEIQALLAPIEDINEEMDEELALAQIVAPKEELTFKLEPVTKPTKALVKVNEVENVSEEEGRNLLMSLIDQKIGPSEVSTQKFQENKPELVEHKLNQFLRKIQQRALEYQSRV